MQTWQMQAAKAHFSELVQSSQSNGPQEITLHGQAVAVVISRELFDRLSGNSDNFVDFMRQSPLYELDDIQFERDRSLARKIKL